MLKKLDWLLRIVAAVILLQTLYFKFSGAPEPIALFTELGAEPAGRYISGLMEFCAAILMLWPGRHWLGCLLGTAIMGGALASHVFILGINFQNDGGALFTMAALVFGCCLASLWINRNLLPWPQK